MRVCSCERSMNTPPQESGLAMIAALAVVMVLALISVALASLAMSEYSTAATLDRSGQAFLAADAGIEMVVAVLRNDNDWNDDANTSGWRPLYVNATFPSDDSGASQIGQVSVYLRHSSGLDPKTNIMIKSIGTVRGATRTIQLDLHRVTGADFAIYSVRPVDTTDISGGGSLQFHGSAYFEGDLTLKGAAQAGFFNDRYVSLSDAPQFLNHLYVGGDLDTITGNPTIGNPYYWVHVAGALNVSGANFNVSNLDSIVPPSFYPRVLDETKQALGNPGNLLETVGGQLQIVRCRWDGSAWVKDHRTNLELSGTSATDTFFLPLETAGAANPCPAASVTIPQVRDSNPPLYRLMWDAQSATAQLVFRAPDRPIYVPGQALFGRDVRYEGLGTVVVGNQPGALVPGTLTAQSGCALDFNGNGACNGTSASGRTIRARISPCQGSPGADNPQSTFARVNALGQGPDLAVFLVNGSSYSNVNANSCAQEMNLVAIVGERDLPPGPTCTYANVKIKRKLQWYGVLMTREMCLGQVPDFWQMPDLFGYLPEWAKAIFSSGPTVVMVRNWKELF